METLNTCCGCYSLKTGSCVAAVLLMIRSILWLVFSAIQLSYADYTLEIVDRSIDLLTSTVFLIFSIIAIMHIRNENIKTIIIFLLLALYLFVENSILLFHIIKYFCLGYTYYEWGYFLVIAALSCVYGYVVLVLYSFFRQLTNAKEAKDMPLQNEKLQTPA